MSSFNPVEGFKYSELYTPQNTSPTKPTLSTTAKSPVREAQRIDKPPPWLNTSLPVAEMPTKEETQKAENLRSEFPSRSDSNSLLFKFGKFIASYTVTQFVFRTVMLPVSLLVKLKVIDKASVSNMFCHTFKLGLLEGSYVWKQNHRIKQPKNDTIL